MPPQGKKKSKANGFQTFLFEYQRVNKKSLAESQMIAGEIWKEMSEQERQPYVRKSKKQGWQVMQPLSKFLQQADDEKLEKAREQQNVGLAIEEFLQTYKSELTTTPFLFFSTSYFYESLQDEIYPAEIAILKQGVYETLHMMVNPGKLPLGSAGPAAALAEKTHKRPLPPKTDGETDYKIILKKILGFIDRNKSSKRMPPIFVKPGLVASEIKAAVKTLDKICSEAGADDIFFRVYPIEELIVRLHKMCSTEDSESLKSVVRVEDKMSRECFTDYDIGCEFHQQLDVNNQCCLAKVKAWGFSIARYCFYEDRDEIPGRHAPINFVDSENEPEEWTSVTESLQYLSLSSSNSDQNSFVECFGTGLPRSSAVDPTIDSKASKDTIDHVAIWRSRCDSNKLPK